MVASLMDVWQQRCSTPLVEVPNSHRAATFTAGRAVEEDHSWCSDLQSPSVGETHRKCQFLKSCRLLDTESLEMWQQQECLRHERLSAQTCGERQKQQLGEEKLFLRMFTSESESTSFPNSSLISTANAASTSVDLERVKHDSFLKSNCGASSIALISSVANTMANVVPLRHGKSTRGHDSTRSVEQQVSQTGFHVSFKQNYLATQHFDMSVGDVDEVEEEFFPEDRPVIDCS